MQAVAVEERHALHNDKKKRLFEILE